MSHAGHNTVFDHDCVYCELRYPKEFDHKVWLSFRTMESVKEIDGKKYYLDVQEMLCKRYRVTLTNYIPKRRRQLIKIQKQVDKIWKVLSIIGGGFLKALNVIKGSNFSNIKLFPEPKRKGKKSKGYKINEPKDYSFLTGKPGKKNHSFIFGKSKPKNLELFTNKSKPKNLSRITLSPKPKNMKHITGKSRSQKAIKVKRITDSKYDGLINNRQSSSGLFRKQKRLRL